MKLSKWAKKHDISYRTAWNTFKAGKIPNAYVLPSGAIMVKDEDVTEKPEWIAVYSRVSSSENKSNLDSQAKRLVDFCNAKGWVVNEVIKECASGLNDKRPKLQKILSDRRATKIVCEHSDRLTRFGLNFIKTLYPGEIIIVNPILEEEADLINDFTSLVTSFCARLYGKRRSKRNTERLIKELNKS